MLLLMIEKGYSIDEIIFCDTGLEFLEMYDHIDKVEAYIGRSITRLKSDKSFEYYMFDHLKTSGKCKGEYGYGWPMQMNRWCTRVFKTDVTKKYLQEKYPDKQIISYNGYAFDEIKRIKYYDKFHQQPLVDYAITEADALKRCYDAGFDWSGLYKRFNRVSCWCCPFQNIKDLRNLYYFYPEYWKILEQWEERNHQQYNEKNNARLQENKSLIKNKCIFRIDASILDLSKRFKAEFEKYNNTYEIKE